jgi:hypothetical protein
LPPENQGKVIIRAIPDSVVRDRLVAFICAHAGSATPESVRGRLERLPLVLAGAIDPVRGERLAATLTGLGAGAEFVPGDEAPLSPQTAAAACDAAAAGAESGGGGDPAASDRQTPRGERRKKAPPTPEQEKLRIALACRIVLIYAILACLVAMSSPLFLIFSAPLALYATHRAVALLEDDLWLRWFFLPGSFVPVLNIAILALMLLRVHLFIRRSTVQPDTIRDELASFRFVCRIGFAALMAIFLLGSANGYLPVSMGEFRESVERMLQKEVEASAKEFPRKVSGELRIESMTAGPAKRLTFNCTLINYRASLVNGDQFRADVRGNIVKEVCGSKEMRHFLDREVIISYAFNGSDGMPITSVDVVNGDCGGR